MNNIYHRDIIEILLECGCDGLRIKNIARRIYNKHADFFVRDLDYSEIRDSVGRYLWEQSAIQLDLFLDFVSRSEAHKEQARPTSGPKHIQLELF